jgi:hypothetical protein
MGRIASQHEVRRLCLLCGVPPGWAGAAAVLLLPHTAGVLWAPTVAPLSQLHCTGGHLHPPLRDVRGSAAISAAVPVLLRIEGYEPVPTTHRWLLLLASDTWP